MLPKVHKVIMKYTTILSARTECEEKYPFDIFKWKQLTFLSLTEKIGLLERATLTNLIVLGDAEYEMRAGDLLAKHLNRCIIKQVKFKECPTPDNLIK